MRPYLLLIPIFLLSACNTQKEEATQVSPLTQFDAREVTLAPESEFGKRQVWDEQFMMSLDPHRLLYYFLNEDHRTGIEPYGAWEGMDIKGHTLGHYLTAMSKLYAQKGNAEAKSRVDLVVDGLEECQQRLGNGLITAFRPELLDECDSIGTGWAPYYTLHKILQGLLDAHKYTGNAKALTLADKMGDHIVSRMEAIQRKGFDWQENKDVMEQGGIAEAMLNLYALTHKDRQFEAARFFYQMTKLQPAAEGIDVLNDPQRLSQHRTRQTPNKDYYHNMHHSNATIPQFIGAVRDFELTQDSLYGKAAFNFWDFVCGHRLYCNGTTGYWEHWNYGPDSIAEELGYLAGETCCTYNLIKLSNELFRFREDAKYGDYVEKALVNDILGSIYPETSNFMYFHTMQPGTFKTYGRNAECFWCCTASGMENHQRYVENIYFTDGEKLFVNQYIPSTLNWKEKGLKVEQSGNYPLSLSTTLSVREGNGAFPIAIRKPSYCTTEGQLEVLLNGKPVEAKELQDADGWLTFDRTWKSGDELQLVFHPALRIEKVRNSSLSCIYYGPFVLAGELGDVDPSLVQVTDNFYGNTPDQYKPIANIPALTGDPSHIAEWLKPASDPLSFQTTATSDGSTLLFRPLYQVYDKRFSCYW